MTTYTKGDRVDVTLRGTVTEHPRDYIALLLDGENNGPWCFADATVHSIQPAPPLPYLPEVGDIVIDGDGDVCALVYDFVSNANRWVDLAVEGNSYSFDQLNKPLRKIGRVSE